MAKITREKVGPGQESVWDYPRPPRLERCGRRLQVVFAGEVVAETRAGYRVLETSHPPVYYFPPGDVRDEYLERAPGVSFCEWKGEAGYVSLRVGDRVAVAAGWSYARPSPAFLALKDHLAFYASRVDDCFVDGERVTPQPGGFYGGWITSDVVGPFKGGPGSMGW